MRKSPRVTLLDRVEWAVARFDVADIEDLTEFGFDRAELHTHLYRLSLAGRVRRLSPGRYTIARRVAS